MLGALSTAIFRHGTAALFVAVLAAVASLGACAQANRGGFEDSGSDSD